MCNSCLEYDNKQNMASLSGTHVKKLDRTFSEHDLIDT